MTSSDIVYYKALTINGGAIDLASPITTGQANNLFADVNALSAQNGGYFYRKMFIKNIHGTDTAVGLDLAMTKFSGAGDYMRMFVGTSTDSLTTTSTHLGTGNDVQVTFTGNLSTKVMKKTVVVTAGAVVGTDNGLGVITGTGISTGSINYDSGAFSVTFTVAPANAVSVDTTHLHSTKMYGIAKASEELNRGNKTVTVTVEGSQTLSDIFTQGDKITFIDATLGLKIVRATIATGGVGTTTLTIDDAIDPELVLNGAYIANTIVSGDLSAGSSVSIWLQQTVPALTPEYLNSTFGVTSVFVSS